MNQGEAASGGVVGGVTGHYLGRPIKKDELKELGKQLKPDSSAFLLLLEDVYSEKVIDSMAGFNASVVTLTLGSELSGEIATYRKGVVTDDDGNVVAGASVVAADAEGDVVAVAEVVADVPKAAVVAPQCFRDKGQIQSEQD